MRYLLLAAMLIAWSGTAAAADRIYAVASFERIRVEGPYQVTLATGKSPQARASGEARAIEQLTVTLEGQTLIIRARPQAVGEVPIRPSAPLIVTVQTPLLRSASVRGGGRLTLSGMKAERVDLSVNGAGALDAAGIETDQLGATIIGAGTMRLAGRAGRAWLQLQGPGSYDATGLIANDLNVRSEGTGDTHAAARYTATIAASGLGSVIVDGKAACTVKSSGGGVISCGPAPVRP